MTLQEKDSKRRMGGKSTWGRGASHSDSENAFGSGDLLYQSSGPLVVKRRKKKGVMEMGGGSGYGGDFPGKNHVLLVSGPLKKRGLIRGSE